MKTFSKMALAAVFAGLLASAAPASAQVNAKEPDPAVWLRQVYDLYHRGEKSEAAQKQATTALIEKRASKALSALFRKNHACEKREQGICALDWDFVVDGQDVELSNVKVADAVIDGDKATVTATFRNLGADCVNVYRFVREDGFWKVDEIETKQGKEAPVLIGKLLREYKF